MSSTSTSVENYQLVFTLVTHIFSMTTTMNIKLMNCTVYSK